MNKIRAAVFLSFIIGAAFNFLNELARASKKGLLHKHTENGITTKKCTVKYDGKEDR
jgi:hypothetical protein